MDDFKFDTNLYPLWIDSIGSKSKFSWVCTQNILGVQLYIMQNTSVLSYESWPNSFLESILYALFSWVYIIRLFHPVASSNILQ